MITPPKATKKDKFRGGEVLPLYFRAHGCRTSSGSYAPATSVPVSWTGSILASNGDDLYRLAMLVCVFALDYTLERSTEATRPKPLEH